MDSTLNNEHNKCDEILLSAYLDGEVTVEERRSVEDHVTHCASCAELAARMQHVDDVLRSTLLPKNLHEQMRASIARESSRSSWRRVLRWGGIAAALLISFGLGVWASGVLRKPQAVEIAKENETAHAIKNPHTPEVTTTPFIAPEPGIVETEAESRLVIEPITPAPGPTIEPMKVAGNASPPAAEPEPPKANPKIEKTEIENDTAVVQTPKAQLKKAPNTERRVPANQYANTEFVTKESKEGKAATMDPPIELPPRITVSSLPDISSLEEIKIDLPPPYFGGTPLSYFNDHLEEKSFKPREPFWAPKGTGVISRGKKVTSSDPDPTFGKLSMITDGEKGFQNENLVELGTGPQWVQIDLGEPYKIFAIVIWHFHAADRVYFDVIVQTSPAAEVFIFTLFNNDYDNSIGLGIGEDKEYIESNEGKLIDCGPIGTTSRYVRCYSNGNTTDQTSHYVEIEVWGIPIAKANG
ncbi:MAG: zf-HC2 domain-containing protein [Candidatus Hydrogenedentes bacterium]|nr:zf-HC2 domain-containing protein [Candidatus Hydrogenedentota bacterium]